MAVPNKSKSITAKPAFPRTIGERAQLRIDQGEPWLRVWTQQLAIPLTMIERKAGLNMARLIAIESGKDEATTEEIETIAPALNTDRKSIDSSKRV